MKVKRQLLQQTVSKVAFLPLLVDGSTKLTGVIIDRNTLPESLSMILAMATAAATGTPTAFSYSILVEHGNDSGLSDAANLYTAQTFTNASPTTPKEYKIECDLLLAKRYVRVSITPTFTAGTTPKCNTAIIAVFGDGNIVAPSATATVQLNGTGYPDTDTVLKV